MNHMLYSSISSAFGGIETPNTNAITTTNAASGTGSLGEEAQQCITAYGGRAPTFLLVDFVSKGNTLAVLDSLNGVMDATGRSGGSTSSDSSSTAASSSGAAPNVAAWTGWSVVGLGAAVASVLGLVGGENGLEF